MYPILRLVKERLRFTARPLDLFETHVTTTLCWPWDLDPWMELNNGRTLTLPDLSRIPFMVRLGAIDAMRRNSWGVTVAGSSVRYRRRVRLFQRVELRVRLVGWDARFFYLEQAMMREGAVLNHMLARMAVTGNEGIVAPARLFALLGHEEPGPTLPEWVTAWIEAEDQRPWPPSLGDGSVSTTSLKRNI
jgi:acyl-CoA thioesterase FadM